jgi:predicted amidohydrolase YtcJ
VSDVLFAGGRVKTPDGRYADWVLVRGDAIAGVGTDADRPTAERVVRLDGATLLPGFCDAHVHLPATGLYELGMNFRGEHSADAILARFADRAHSEDAVLFGGNFEDPLDRPLTGADFDAAVGGRKAMLVRADMHSCVVSAALLRELDLEGIPGADRGPEGRLTGYLREQAAARAWTWFDAHLPEPGQREAIGAAARVAYAHGVTTAHEMYVAEWRGWRSLDVLKHAASQLALDIVVYVATTDVERVASMGWGRIGGDFFLDGSFGSHTAWLTEPYDSQPPQGAADTGTSYRSDAEVLDFFSAAQRRGLQTGVHAIGDAAIEQAVSCWERVARDEGIEAVRRLGHRIEHFECASDDHIQRCCALGLRASVQPAFDAFWGGADGMYARRIGWERAAEMNRFGSMRKIGLAVGAGSDSTVTPLDPWLQMRALRSHHVERESLSGEEAFVLHTLGSCSLADEEHMKGSIEPGKRADFALAARDPATTPADELTAVDVLGTWVAGRRVWPPEAAEAA